MRDIFDNAFASAWKENKELEYGSRVSQSDLFNVRLPIPTDRNGWKLDE